MDDIINRAADPHLCQGERAFPTPSARIRGFLTLWHEVGGYQRVRDLFKPVQSEKEFRVLGTSTRLRPEADSLVIPGSGMTQPGASPELYSERSVQGLREWVCQQGLWKPPTLRDAVDT